MDRIHNSINKDKWYCFSTIILKVFSVLFFSTFTFLFLSLCFFNNSLYFYSMFKQLFCAIILLAVLLSGYFGICHLIKIKPTIKIFLDIRFTPILIIGMVIIFIIQIFYVYQFHTNIGWDCGVLIATSQVPVLGESEQVVEYYSLYPNNLFLLFCFRMVYKICMTVGITNSLIPLIIINILAVDAAMFFIILISKKAFGKKTAYISWVLSLLLIGFFPWLIVPYSDTLSMPCVISAIYFYMCILSEKTLWKKLVLSLSIGLIVSVGFTIKPTVIIVLIAILIAHILFTKINKKRFLGSAAIFASMIIFFAAANVSIQAVMNNQNTLKLKENVSAPMTHFFMMGMSEIPVGDRSFYGAWNEKDVNITFSKETTDEMKEINIAEIKSRFSEYGFRGYSKHLINKARWITSEGTFFWGGEGNFAEWPAMKSDTFRETFQPAGENYQSYLYFSQAVWIITMLCMIVPLLFNKINSRNKTLFILRLSTFGILLFIMLFEGRSRYLINFLPCFIVLASYGFNCMVSHQKLKLPKFLKNQQDN